MRLLPLFIGLRLYSALIHNQLLAFYAPALKVGKLMLFLLLLKEFLNKKLFIALSVELVLGLGLVNHHLTAATVALLSREVLHVFLLFNLVHSGSI